MSLTGNDVAIESDAVRKSRRILAVTKRRQELLLGAARLRHQGTRPGSSLLRAVLILAVGCNIYGLLKYELEPGVFETILVATVGYWIVIFWLFVQSRRQGELLRLLIEEALEEEESSSPES